MSKIVFISYAHVTRDEYLERFVRELAHEVLINLENAEADDVAFYDAQRIETGEYWRERLAAELVGCKACVAVCSPAFAASPFCGKELQVFLDRVNAWRAGQAAGHNARSPVFPVIWIGTQVPPALAPFQNVAGKFPPVYAEKGLRTMYRMGKYAQRRTEILLALAEWISEAVKSVDLPPRAGIPDFDHITSLFDDQEAPLRHGVALLPLLHGKTDHRPFGGTRTLGDFAAVAFGNQVPSRVLDQSGDIRARLRRSRDEHEIALVVTDLATLSDPLWRTLLDNVDAGLAPPAAVAVLRSPTVGTDDEEQNAALTVQSAFSRAIAAGVPVDWTSLRSSSALEVHLSHTVLSLRTEMINRLQPVAVVDPALVMAAGQAGVPIHRQPTVAGPGGAR